jgi:hypothetical protein
MITGDYFASQYKALKGKPEDQAELVFAVTAYLLRECERLRADIKALELRQEPIRAVASPMLAVGRYSGTD